MAEQAGIDLMRRRIERASRQPPPPRKAAETTAQADDPAVSAAPAPAPASDPETVAAARPARRASTRRRPERMRVGADAAPVNLAIRVRRPLDDRLVDIIHGLRGQGVRTSKVELIEMLLWELPDDQLAEVRERLRQFRDWAPRGTGAPLEAAAD